MRISDWSSDVCSSDLSSLVGWAEFSRPLTNPSQVDIIENGEVIARAPLTFAAAKPLMGHFRIPLPTGVFDGRPHLLMLETEGGKCRLGQYATVTPTSLTSDARSEEHTSELQSLMRTSNAVF